MQAIVNNLAPLLFVSFQNEYNVSLLQIGGLITVNFAIQIIIDLMSVKLVDVIGYRVSAVLSQVFCALGLISLGALPGVFHAGYPVLLFSISLSAIGSGLSEVVISPIIESLPCDEKSASMSLLHSFYSWGQVTVVLLSTLYFVTFGRENWKLLPVLWSALPVINTFLFAFVPLKTLVEKGQAMPLKKLFASGIFWMLWLLMIAAGASEQAMAQWASLFAEEGLKISKTMGDLLGPCTFAALMGVARSWYGIRGGRINLKKALAFSSALCIVSYLFAVLSRNPVIALCGCGFTGFSVGLMWPGVYSLSAELYPSGGTSMFALLAFGGDVGCTAGPMLVATLSDGFSQSDSPSVISSIFSGTASQTSLKFGLAGAVIFPVIMLIGVLLLKTAGIRRKTNIHE